MTGKKNVWLSGCAFLSLVAIVAGCGERRAGNGNVVTKPRNVAGFTSVWHDTQFPLNVRESSATTVSVTLDENLQDYVVLNVVNGTLKIETSPGVHLVGFSSSARIDVTLPRLEKAELEGLGAITLRDIAAGSTLTLVTDGAGELDYVGSVPMLNVSLHGFGDVKLNGSANSLVLQSTGTGALDARNLVATSAEIRSEGTGNVYARLNGGTLKLGIHGIGNIEWWGTAEIIEWVNDGEGSVIHH